MVRLAGRSGPWKARGGRDANQRCTQERDGIHHRGKRSGGKRWLRLDGRLTGRQEAAVQGAGDDPSMVLTHLLGQLTDRNPGTRAAAIEALGRSDDLEAIDALGRVVARGDRREAVGYAMAWIGQER